MNAEGEVSEHPILFSGEMVRAILDGRKTQTRRVMITTKGVQKIGGGKTPKPSSGNLIFEDGAAWDSGNPRPIKPIAVCPYGIAGDRLWVRETLTKCQDSEASNPLALYETGRQQVYHDGRLALWQWRGEHCPSIFMPRWASRITLEIVKVRVERVQDISALDALDEGIKDEVTLVVYPATPQRIADASKKIAIERYKELWDSINAKRGYSWESNPWIWVIEFKRVEK